VTFSVFFASEICDNNYAVKRRLAQSQRVALPVAISIGSPIQKKGSPYSITERRVPELIPVLGSQPANGVNHKPVGRLPLLYARPAVTPATIKRAATNFAAW